MIQPSVKRNTKLLVRLIHAPKIIRDDVLELVNAYMAVYEEARHFHSLYTTERASRQKLEAENNFLLKLIRERI